MVGPDSEIFDVKETVTDNNGIFCFPPYITLISPIYGDDIVVFIFYKPGYSHSYYPLNYSSNVRMGAHEEEKFFSEKFGEKGRLYFNSNPTAHFKSYSEWHDVIYGIIQVPKSTTKEERMEAHKMITSTPFKHRNKTPIYNKICEQEYELLFPKKENEFYRGRHINEIKPQSGKPPSGGGATILRQQN